MEKNRKPLFAVLIAVLFYWITAGSGASAEVIFVKADATGDNSGTSWQDARTDLQSALSDIESGEIWVASGTYKPTTETSRNATFQLKNNVGIYGGFNGTEENREDRNPDDNITILSGDIGEEDNLFDNVYNVVTAENVFSSAVLDGFVITKGNADNTNDDIIDGGGLYIDTGNPVIKDCTFSDNTAYRYGGGIYMVRCNSKIDTCVFTNNKASNSGALTDTFGGGLFIGESSSPLVTFCTFSGNTADEYGGGIAVILSSNLTLTNSVLHGNYGTSGGGIYAHSGTLTLTNNTISGNTSAHGGGVFGIQNTTTIVNCTIANNETDRLKESVDAQGGGIRVSTGAEFAVFNSIIGNNYQPPDDPFNPDEPDDCVVDPGGILTSDGGNLVETGCSGVFTQTGDVTGSAANPNLLPLEENGGPTVTHALMDDSPALNNGIVAGAPLEDQRGYSRDAEPDIGAYEVDGGAPVLYVKWDATGLNDGSSWQDAYTSLQRAMDEAYSEYQIWVARGTYYPPYYFPPDFSPHINITTSDDLKKYTTFYLRDGVQVYGGFAGNETNLADRQSDPTTQDADHKTILSGDIDQNDESDPQVEPYRNLKGYNSSHVVTTGINLSSLEYGGGQSGAYYYETYPVSSSTILDGFEITAGYAGLEGSGNNWPFESGGGMLVFGNPTIRNVYFRVNYALNGGGAVTTVSDHATFVNCLFEYNHADGYGGAVENSAEYATGSRASIKGCAFRYNTSNIAGGAVSNYISSITIKKSQEKDSYFEDNTSIAGGAVYNHASDATIKEALFLNNFAYSGGAIENVEGSEAIINNCAFTENGSRIDQAGGEPDMKTLHGGAVNNSNSSPEIADCVFTSNRANYGGAMVNYDSSSPDITNIEFTGNIADYSGGAVYNDVYSDPTLTTCRFTANTAMDINGGGGGMYNIDNCTPQVIDSLFESNVASNGNGGGVFNKHNSSPNISGTTFKNNTAAKHGGAIYSTDLSGVGVDDVSGGLLITRLTNNTFYGNQANESGGGLYTAGDVDSAKKSYTSITNCTFTENTADNDGNGSGSGGGVYFVDNSSVNVKNTIIAGNWANATSNDCVTSSSQINSSGSNLVKDGCSADFNGAIDLLGVDPNLDDQLRNNGNPNNGDPVLETAALLTGSPAINAGSGDINALQVYYIKHGALDWESGIYDEPASVATFGCVWHQGVAGEPTSNPGEHPQEGDSYYICRVHDVPDLDQRGVGRNGLPDSGSYEYRGKPAVIILDIDMDNVTPYQALIQGKTLSHGGSVVDPANITDMGICIRPANDPNPCVEYSATDQNVIDAGIGIIEFDTLITGLERATEYEVRAYAANDAGTTYSDRVITFTTKAVAPTIETSLLGNVTATTAEVGGEQIDNGGAHISAKGSLWVLKTDQPANPDDFNITNFPFTIDGEGSADFTSVLRNLTPYTTYVYRAYATNIIGTGYGTIREFTTLALPPTVVTNTVSESSFTYPNNELGVLLNGTVLDAGMEGVCNEKIDEAGFCIDTSPISGSNCPNPATTSLVTGICRLQEWEYIGLLPQTSYYYRAWATNNAGLTGLGNVETFTTGTEPAELTTVSAYALDETSAFATGRVDDDHGGTLQELGICAVTNTDSYPQAGEMDEICTSVTIGDYIVGENYDATLTNLSPNTLYYALAYAITDDDIAVPDTPSKTAFAANYIPFFTDALPPEVETIYPPVMTGQTSAVVQGNVISDGGDSNTTRGMCWGPADPNPQPGLSTCTADKGRGGGEYEIVIENLTPGLAYNYQAYALNVKGEVVLGGVQTLILQSLARPLMETILPFSYSSTSAFSGITLYSADGVDLTEMGICYTQSAFMNPKIRETCSPDLSDCNCIKVPQCVDPDTCVPGDYPILIDGLMPQTDHRVIAYTRNTFGQTHYDSNTTILFRTLADTQAAPSIATLTVQSVTTDSASTGGSLYVDPNAANITIVDQGICWDTNPTPTLADNVIADPGTFTSPHYVYTAQLTGLSPATDHYVRAYVHWQDSGGDRTSYGNEMVFTTEPPPIPRPEVLTQDVIDIVGTTATGGGIIVSVGDPGDILVDWGVCWSLNANPGTTDPGSVCKTAPIVVDSFEVDMTNLTPCSQYYVVAYATNNWGITDYGSIKNFFTNTPIGDVTGNCTLEFLDAETVLQITSGQSPVIPPDLWNTNQDIDGSGDIGHQELLNILHGLRD